MLGKLTLALMQAWERSPRNPSRAAWHSYVSVPLEDQTEECQESDSALEQEHEILLSLTVALFVRKASLRFKLMKEGR